MLLLAHKNHCKNGQEKIEEVGFKNQFVLITTSDILKKAKFELISRLNLSNLPTKITKAKIAHLFSHLHNCFLSFFA